MHCVACIHNLGDQLGRCSRRSPVVAGADPAAAYKSTTARSCWIRDSVSPPRGRWGPVRLAGGTNRQDLRCAIQSTAQGSGDRLVALHSGSSCGLVCEAQASGAGERPSYHVVRPGPYSQSLTVWSTGTLETPTTVTNIFQQAPLGRRLLIADCTMIGPRPTASASSCG